MDPEACKLLTQQSVMVYYHFASRNPAEAATEYEQFLSRRFEWSASIGEGGKVVIIQSIFNLKRSYLDLGESDKAQNALQDLWDLTKSTSISIGHLLFTELAVLFYEVKDASSKVSLL